MSMKIGNSGSGKAVGATKPKKGAKGAASASGKAFAAELNAASSATTPEGLTDGGIVEAASVEGVDAILAMQETGDSSEQLARKQACAYGEDLLNKLKVIQDGLLFGAIPKDRLAELAHKIRSSRARVQDPRLNEILGEIELRAEVEIAKYTRNT